MTKYCLSAQLKTIIDSLPVNVISENHKDKLLLSPFLSHTQIISIYKAHKKFTSDSDSDSDSSDSSDLTLLQLVSSCKSYAEPAAAASEKTPEYTQLMEKLRLKQQELEYQDLIRGDTGDMSSGAAMGHRQSLKQAGDDDDGPRQTASQQMKELRNQLTTILNMFVSVASVGYAVWYWSGTSMGNYHLNDGYRVLLALAFALLVLVAEVVVFSGYLRRVDEAREKERGKREVRTVLASVVLE
ncbi:unnamed protein product [[Candida] boidinii]|nr:unnamed protein product [[Candida] boidinii]